MIMASCLYYLWLLSHWLRKDETEWMKYQAKKSKRHSMMHVVSVQHMKEQNTKGDEWLWLHVKNGFMLHVNNGLL